MSEREETPIDALVPHMGDTPVAPAHGIAAIALTMALKYHDINTVQDGILYQQYKMEGRNMRELHLDMVFETAMRIEVHLLGASQRIAAVVVDAIQYGMEHEDDQSEGPESDPDTDAEPQEPRT